MSNKMKKVRVENKKIVKFDFCWAKSKVFLPFLKPSHN